MIGCAGFHWLRVCSRVKKSMVLLGLPFFLTQMTILWQHVTGPPMGTGSKTPSLTTLLSQALTSPGQCSGMGMGEWWENGVTLESIINLMGGPSINGRI